MILVEGEIYIYSVDKAFMNDMLSQHLKGDSKSRYIYYLRLGSKDVTYPGDFDRVWFVNKTVREMEVAERERREAEIARKKDQERQEAIEKEKQKAAKSMETLNMLGEFLKNSGKKQ